MFLNQIQSEGEKTGDDFIEKFLEILIKQEFIAKERIFKILCTETCRIFGKKKLRNVNLKERQTHKQL